MAAQADRAQNDSYHLRIDAAWAFRWRELGEWLDLPIGSEFEMFCASHADDLFVVDGTQRLTFGAFDEVVNRLTRALSAKGVGRGDTVAFQLPSWWETLAITHAAFRLGSVVAPIAPNLRAHELRYILRSASPKVIFFPEQFRGAQWSEILQDVKLDEKQVVGVRGNLGAQSFDSLLAAGDDVRHTADVDPLMPALLLFTSGSTSVPKGVLHGHNSLLAEAKSIQRTHEITARDVMLMPYPVTHIGGFAYGALLPFVSGMTVVLLDVWEPKSALDLMAAEGVTFLSAVPPVIDSLLDCDAFSPNAAERVRLIAMGGTRVTAAGVVKTATAFDCVCKRGYGSTEMPTYTSTPADPDPSTWAASDGLPTGVSEIRIVDDAGRPLPLGSLGEILAQGPELFMGYLDPELNDDAFTDDGWFRTGDLGTLDERGAVRIDGRKKDIIIRNGENISAAEVEELLLAHPRIRDVAVVAVPDPEVGERACAVVVTSGAAFDMPEMVRFLQSQALARFKIPEALVEFDVLPMTANGKIRKDVLRRELNQIGWQGIG
jgi:cyclohexanecarboxylate-CoA ligase